MTDTEEVMACAECRREADREWGIGSTRPDQQHVPGNDRFRLAQIMAPAICKIRHRERWDV